jgi:hypothetical protein
MPEAWKSQWSIHVAVNFVTRPPSVARYDAPSLSFAAFFQSQAHISSTSLPSMIQSGTEPTGDQTASRTCEVARKDEAEKTRRLDARLIPHVRK